MKDIISKKSSMSDEIVRLLEQCNTILQRKILIKRKDHGSVTIPCTIRDKTFKKSLIDICAIVSLISLSIYKKLSIGKVSDTMMTFQFVDHSIMFMVF